MQSNNPTINFVNQREEIMRAAMRNDSHGNIGIGDSNISIGAQPSIPPSNAYIRAQFLDEVEKLVCKDRNVTHGDAEDNFRVIAELWNVYLHNSPGENCHDLTNKDVAIMMCLFKISRLMSNVNNMENWLDLAGYAACGGGIVKKLEVK